MTDVELLGIAREAMAELEEPVYHVMEVAKDEYWEQLSDPLSLEEAKTFALQYPKSVVFRRVQ